MSSRVKKAERHYSSAIETASSNSLESDLGCKSRVYFDTVTLMSHYVTLASQRPCQYNNNLNCSETNGNSIPQDSLNEV